MKTELAVEMNTSQAEGALDRLANKANQTQNAISGGRSDMAWSRGDLPAMTDGISPMDQNGQLIQNVNNSYSLMDIELKNIIESFKRFREVLKNAEMMPQPGSGHQPVDPNPDNAPGTTSAQDSQRGNINIAGGVIGASQGFSDAARSIAGGDPWSAGLGGLNRVGQGAMKIGTGNDGTMNILGMLGVAGVAAALLGTGANAISGQYENALGGIDSLLTAFGGDSINRNSAQVNAGAGINLRSIAANMSLGTGLETDEFISYMSSLSRYGVTDANRAGSLTNAAAGWSRYSGADMGQVLNFMGFAERYGADGREATMSAYNAARASGLEKGQFSEFLSGIERVMEDGIAKGFIKSSEEVANSLANLSLLGGGNKVFQGESGARMYMNMASGMAGNTALASTGNLLMYRTMSSMMGEDDANAQKLLGEGNFVKGGSIYNELALMEKGDVGNVDFLKTLRGSVEGAFGGDTDSIIATYKEMFGLNNQGAIQFYNALHSGNLDSIGAGTADTLKKLQEDPGMKSDATRLQDTLTELNKAIVEMGKPVFDVKLGGLDVLESGVNKIYDWLVGDSYKSLVESALKPLYTEDEKHIKGNTQKQLMSMLESNNPNDRSKAIAIIDRLNSLSDEEKAGINMANLDPLNLPDVLPKSTYNAIKNAKPDEAKYSLREVFNEIDIRKSTEMFDTRPYDELKLSLEKATLSGATESDIAKILEIFKPSSSWSSPDVVGAIEETNRLLERLGDKMESVEVEVGR